ncbi:hypothetical protein TGPRC2_318220 [Toxoplasma gondii TgCatPRC2]|uniref:Uncharacterized protein n=4 Tax=Toxoplasma gondii TaxID=5811 RepID=S7UKF4_TOXGG|nr:hypothetical protein TGME49_318220 [Toxoplasma gondii ME49]EPR58237.1 hypothetical protein TGGT1_318220 [Toxoplasma gondii GT1]EPT31435.1 hypothetical protein TGME49_318220 [Toxoplasma gondii ME49]KAF4645015.1 hypothetical protein TGRH88_008310 [Toxoplasma gondii]KYK66956.1 hypothetical protein TGPRC2_318220 [Toxoplasma gondii TgCatPRC2]|eukprot:XP_002369761.1 hypothetical protein TGME49_318220 [Toxoplasma gondii ME49]
MTATARRGRRPRTLELPDIEREFEPFLSPTSPSCGGRREQTSITPLSRSRKGTVVSSPKAAATQDETFKAPPRFLEKPDASQCFSDEMSSATWVNFLPRNRLHGVSAVTDVDVPVTMESMEPNALFRTSGSSRQSSACVREIPSEPATDGDKGFLGMICPCEEPRQSSYTARLSSGRANTRELSGPVNAPFFFSKIKGKSARTEQNNWVQWQPQTTTPPAPCEDPLAGLSSPTLEGFAMPRLSSSRSAVYSVGVSASLSSPSPCRRLRSTCQETERRCDRGRTSKSPAVFPKLRNHLHRRQRTDPACNVGGEWAAEISDSDAIEPMAIKEIQRENRLLKVSVYTITQQAHSEGTDVACIACIEDLQHPNMCDDRKTSKETLAIRQLQAEKQQLQTSLLQTEAARLRDVWLTKTAQAVAAAEMKLRRSYEELQKKRETQHASEVATLQIAQHELEKRLEAAQAQANEAKVTGRGAETHQEQLDQAHAEEARKLREEISALRVTFQKETARLTEAGKEQLAQAQQEIVQLRERCEAEQKQRHELENAAKALSAAPRGSTAAVSGDDIHSKSRRKHVLQVRKLRNAEDVALLKATLAAHRARTTLRALIRNSLQPCQNHFADAGEKPKQAQSKTPTAGNTPTPTNDSHQASPTNQLTAGLGNPPSTNCATSET